MLSLIFYLLMTNLPAGNIQGDNVQIIPMDKQAFCLLVNIQRHNTSICSATLVGKEKPFFITAKHCILPDTVSRTIICGTNESLTYVPSKNGFTIIPPNKGFLITISDKDIKKYDGDVASIDLNNNNLPIVKKYSKSIIKTVELPTEENFNNILSAINIMPRSINCTLAGLSQSKTTIQGSNLLVKPKLSIANINFNDLNILLSSDLSTTLSLLEPPFNLQKPSYYAIIESGDSGGAFVCHLKDSIVILNVISSYPIINGIQLVELAKIPYELVIDHLR